jgi:hypothetical protein
MNDQTQVPKPFAAPSPSRIERPRHVSPAPAAAPAQDVDFTAWTERAARFGHHFERVSVSQKGAGAEPLPAAGGMPIQRVEIPPEERAKPKQFMRARAHLAAVLTGASSGELQTEVEKSREQVNRWESTADSPVSKSQAQGVYEQTLLEDYNTAKRFQSDAEHYKPRTGQDKTAVEQVRALHGGEYTGPTTESPLQHFGAAYLGARHTKGHNESDFVSLATDPSKLLTSKDDGGKGAQTIAKKASHLHTYTFPKVFGWDTHRLAGTLEQEPGTLDEEIDGPGQTFREWLSSTPREEGEVLFHGGNLNKYRTRQEVNPFLPKKKKGGKGKR